MRYAKITLFFLFCLFLVSALYLGWEVNGKKYAAGEDPIYINIEPGESVEQVARDLRTAGAISNAWLFKMYLKFSGQDKKIQSGYGLVRGGSWQDIAATLAGFGGKSVAVLLPEGTGVEDYDRVLWEQGVIAGKGVFTALVGEPRVNYCRQSDKMKPRDFSAEFDFLRDKSGCYGLEGYLFPDTYFFSRNALVEDIARVMLDNFGKKLGPDLRAEISRQGKDINQIVIMASLIEAEAREERDRGMVSDILWRRLKAGIGLELDSTVNYVTAGKRPAISLLEKEIDSLYNTYKYRGLPPGPINNPGWSAISAAVYPVPNDYWFFLTGRDGKMYYAETLAEHNRWKYLYLK